MTHPDQQTEQFQPHPEFAAQALREEITRLRQSEAALAEQVAYHRAFSLQLQSEAKAAIADRDSQIESLTISLTQRGAESPQEPSEQLTLNHDPEWGRGDRPGPVHGQENDAWIDEQYSDARTEAEVEKELSDSVSYPEDTSEEARERSLGLDGDSVDIAQAAKDALDLGKSNNGATSSTV